jgi:hypothetical protein
MADYRPYFLCSCGNHIWLPIPLPATYPENLIPWPSHGLPQSFVCGKCLRASVYRRSQVLREEIKRPALKEALSEASVFQLTVPCAIERCASQLEIHLVVRKRADLKFAERITSQINLLGVPCAKGLHTHVGPPKVTIPIAFDEDAEWNRFA